MANATETFTRQIKISQPPRRAEISTLQKRVENREQDQRHRQRFEQPDDEQAEQAEILIAHAGHDRPGLENDAEGDARGHAYEHPCVKRQSRPPAAWGRRRKHLVHQSAARNRCDFA